MASRPLYFHGVDGETGRYLFSSTTSREIAAVARREATDRGEVARLEHWLEQLEARRRLREGSHRGGLAQAGWGAIFAADDPTVPAVREALDELLMHRHAQATRINERHFQEFAGERGYLPGEGTLDFLCRHGVAPGAIDPERVPYYLLIIGEPAAIPFSFQYQLDVEYAVGRICFDTLAEYATYARSVVAAETSLPLRRRRAVFFAPRHPGDCSTDFSAGDLAAPLAASLTHHQPGWEVATAFGPQATKALLASLVEGKEEAALVFTAGHGVGYPSGHPLQRRRQGALLCGDFPGFEHTGAVAPEHCFAADDVSDAARLQGLVTFHFSCYSAGAPAIGGFPPASGASAGRVAPRPFLSQLAQRLVGHPKGGALAVIGQVDRAWQLPIGWPGAGRLVPSFEKALDRLFAGQTVGCAMEPFGERLAQLSADLSAELEDTRYGAPLDEEALSRLWTGRNDCRDFTVIGDPAVRLVTGAEPDKETEPEIPRGAAVH
jgi:hypothetical protein